MAAHVQKESLTLKENIQIQVFTGFCLFFTCWSDYFQVYTDPFHSNFIQIELNQIDWSVYLWLLSYKSGYKQIIWVL